MLADNFIQRKVQNRKYCPVYMQMQEKTRHFIVIWWPVDGSSAAKNAPTSL